MENRVLFPLIQKNIVQLPLYITGISLKFSETGVIREAGLADYQWAFSIKGKGKLIIEDEAYILEEGTAFFFKKNVPHSYEGIDGDWYTKWITFEGYVLEDLFKYMGIEEKIIIKVTRHQEIDDMFNKIYYLLQSPQHNQDAMLKASGILYRFLIHMNDLVKTMHQDGKTMSENRLKPLIELMNQDLRQTLTLEEMAAAVSFNKYYLCKIFKEIYGMPPFYYLNHIRVQKAKAYLINNDKMKIKEIGEMVGFNDTSYFCSTFKKIEGCTPVEFKNKYRRN